MAAVTGVSTPSPTLSETNRPALAIDGGVPLRGEVTIGGAKNAALPILAATLLTSEECVINAVPDLADISTMASLLRALGAEVDVDYGRHRISVRAAKISSTSAPAELVGKMRASFLV